MAECDLVTLDSVALAVAETFIKQSEISACLSRSKRNTIRSAIFLS